MTGNRFAIKIISNEVSFNNVTKSYSSTLVERYEFTSVRCLLDGDSAFLT